MRDEDWADIAPEFTSDEFRDPNKMGYEFMIWLKQLRQKVSFSIHVAGGWRSPVRNQQVGGAANSEHIDIPCDAVDIRKVPTATDPNWNQARFAIVKAALELGCTRIGIYPSGSLHLDRAEAQRPANVLWIAVDNPAKGI
jgi:uncharacterized protein YcbK (DUF882 family)